jgi:type 1 fimbria pilin
MRLFEAHHMKLLLTPSLWKTAFAGVLLGALAMGHAQTNDQGTLNFSGTISKTTCVLSFGDAQSTLAGRKTLSFGSIPTSQIPTGQFQGFLSLAPKQTVILSVKNADGSTCDGIGNGKWDVRTTVPTANVVTATGGTTALQSDGDRGATPLRFTLDIGIVLQTSVNATVGNTNVDLGLIAGGSTFAFLSGPGSNPPGLSANDTLAVSAQFITVTSGTRTPGAYSVSIPLTVFYQ